MPESGRPASTPLVRWVGLGMLVPGCVLLIFLFDLCSKTSFSNHYLSAAEAQKVITERADASFSVEQYEGGLRIVQIRLPENSRSIGLYAAANDSTLALLAAKGIACPTHVHGRHFLGLPMPQQFLALLSMFLVPAGLVLLLNRPYQVESAASPPAVAPDRGPKKSRFYELLVAIRTEPGLGKTFRRLFMTVFLLVLGLSIARAFLMLPYYASTARLKVISAGSTSVLDEWEEIQSERVLAAVVEKMDLNHRWRNGYGRGAVLNSSDSLLLLKMRTDLRPAFDSNSIEIQTFAQDADEAAALANAIAEADLNLRNQDRPRVEIVEKASPALKPVGPNKPKYLLYGTVAGVLFGSLAGISAAGLRRWRGRRG
jgi:capsular polysaccharide biosynthesis protein